MELLSLLGRNGFLPHGYCFTWSPGLLWSMVGSDAVIAAAYFSIPLAVLSYVRRRPEPTTNWVAWLFSAFIFSCGTTHLMDIWTIWKPDYGLQTLTKIVTAAISLVTAVVLWPLIPRALKIPSSTQLRSAIGTLETEVSHRRHAEDQLAAIQQSLAVTLAGIDAGFITTGPDGQITYMNALAESVTGWSLCAATGVPIREVFDLWIVEDKGGTSSLISTELWNSMQENSMPTEAVRRVVCIARGGVHTTLEVRATLTRAHDGQVIGLAVVFRDMSRIDKAEAESRRLAAIVESSNDTIIGMTLDGRITSWNGAAQMIFGYRAEEAVGQPIQMLIPLHRQDEEMRILAGLAHGKSVRAFDTVRLRRDGEPLDVSVTISPIRDREGRVVGASKIARDVSEQRRAETALRNSGLTAQRLEAENRQIQEASRLKSQFLANMSHELRTPLNAVIGFADLLHSGFVKPESPKHQEYLGHIGTSGRHLLQLINDVLDLSKIESGKFDFFPELLDLSALLKEVQDILHTAVMQKDIRISTHVDVDLTDLMLDPARLKQVLYNYLSNALKFTPTGGHVTVRATSEGPEHFRIEVEDTGIGISAADLPRLFTEFQQLDAGYSKQHQGTGLGLALTRRLVEAQGGQVGVESKLGTGSVFHIVMNRTHGLDLQRAETLAQGPVEREADRVLVIEDDEKDQALLIEALAQAGFEVDSAADGPYALRRARETAYAALTLDLSLPDRRGLELLDDIRRGGASCGSPVVGVTMLADLNNSAAFGIANVLCKPLRSDELSSAMSRFRLRGERRANVMVIDDEEVSLDLMRAMLKSLGIDAVCFQDGRIALQEIDRHRPDAIVLDLMMPEFDGFQVLDALQSLPAWRDVPVFIWTSMLLADDEYAILARSARAILVKGGGTMDAVLESVRRWRLPVLVHTGAQS